jgi:hypothetical protein
MTGRHEKPITANRGAEQVKIADNGTSVIAIYTEHPRQIVAIK